MYTFLNQMRIGKNIQHKDDKMNSLYCEKSEIKKPKPLVDCKVVDAKDILTNGHYNLGWNDVDGRILITSVLHLPHGFSSFLLFFRYKWIG